MKSPRLKKRRKGLEQQAEFLLHASVSLVSSQKKETQL